MKKFLLIVIVFLLLPLGVLADGFVYFPTNNYDSWNQKEQIGAIHYEDGYENLLISVGLEDNKKNDKAVWILPIPANPEQVEIDIINAFPELTQESVFREAINKIDKNFGYMFMSQLYPLPIIGIRYFILGQTLGTTESGNLDDIKNTVTVYKRIEKMGLISELVTTKNKDTLQKYLEKKNLKLPQELSQTLNYYINKDYSLVITWISDINKAKSSGQAQKDANFLSVFTRFPTKEIYYPMKLTSVYGEKVIDISIYLSDLYQLDNEKFKTLYPKMYICNEGYCEKSGGEKMIDYFFSDIKIPDTLKKFFNNKKIDKIYYTQIDIQTASKNFQEDIWIKPEVPLRFNFIKGVINYFDYIGFIIFILITFLSSIIAAKRVSKKYQINSPELKKLLWLSLFHFGTIIIYIFAINRLLYTDKKMQKTYCRWFMFLFLVFVIILSYMFRLPLLISTDFLNDPREIINLLTPF